MNRRFVPLEFAKAHILKIEEDMRKMHERHVKLMADMEDNYQMIEHETTEYYVEFLSKWKELAKTKIARYKHQCERLLEDRIEAVKQRDLQIEALNEKIAI